jgi:vacuolar-type H+-ATPase subunit E/Vma4
MREFMPDINEKLDKFKQLVLDDAARERDDLLQQVDQERTQRLAAAEAEIKREVDAKTQARASVISGESGREISRHLLADKRVIATRREEIAHEVFAAVREKILEFTKTDDYLPHLKKLYKEAFDALDNPYDGVILLRPEDMHYAKELSTVLPGRHVTFQEGKFTLGGLIVDCHSKLLRADQSYDTALGDLDGHFAELFGLSLADD